MDDLLNRIGLSLLLILFILAFGTVGYMMVEGWNFLDSLFMTMITLTTVGYKEVHPLSPNGEMFTLVLLVGGVGIIFYTLNAAARVILEGELQDVFGRRRLEKRIKELKDHYIVCGYGAMGRVISRELKEKEVNFVVIDKDPDDFLLEEDILVFEGDATRDEVLIEVGIERAKGLVAVLPTDAQNLFVVLSARGLNSELVIVSRAVDERAEEKILRAGADKVVSSDHIGGLRLAYILLKPAVMDFVEFATKSGNIELQLEEVRVREDSKFAGLTLDESGIGKKLGIIVVAIKKPDGEMEVNPTSKSVIRAGDTWRYTDCAR